MNLRDYEVVLDPKSRRLPAEADFLRVWNGIAEPLIRNFNALYVEEGVLYRDCTPNAPDIDAILAGDEPELIPYNERTLCQGIGIVSNTRQQTMVALVLAYRINELFGDHEKRRTDAETQAHHDRLGNAFKWVFDNLRLDLQILFMARCRQYDFEFVPPMLGKEVYGTPRWRQIWDCFHPNFEHRLILADPRQILCIRYVSNIVFNEKTTDFDPAVVGEQVEL